MSNYFVIFSSTSRNGFFGLTPRVTYADAQQIAEWAFDEVIESGVSLEDLAGIPCIETDNGDYIYERELTDAEILEHSIEKLSDDGRVFRVFETPAAFIEAATRYGLAEKAKELIDEEGA